MHQLNRNEGQRKKEKEKEKNSLVPPSHQPRKYSYYNFFTLKSSVALILTVTPSRSLLHSSVARILCHTDLSPSSLSVALCHTHSLSHLFWQSSFFFFALNVRTATLYHTCLVSFTFRWNLQHSFYFTLFLSRAVTPVLHSIFPISHSPQFHSLFPFLSDFHSFPNI